MDHDYYEILGVKADASYNALRAAYRARAQECHPDRGGTHAQMILLNEAWHVLSDVTTRREYDHLRTQHASAAESAAFVQEVQAARAEASRYPRDWASFESWLDGITRDVTSAEYGTTKLHGFDVATASNSISGWLIVNITGLAGAVLGVVFMTQGLGWELRGSWMFNPFKLGFLLLGFSLGSFAGARIHQSLRAALAIVPATRGGSPNAEVRAVVISCPHCGQRLRVPQSRQELMVTCRTCGDRLSWPTDVGNQGAKSS